MQTSQRRRSSSASAGRSRGFVFVSASAVAVVSLLLLATLPGCAPYRGEIIATRSDNAESIPTRIGVYPILSAPNEFKPLGRPIDIFADKRQIYIQPPSETTLAVTPLSQMLTGLVSSEFAARGFDLREIPVEIPGEADSKGLDNRVFVVSMDLLQYLRANYDLHAILIGNVVFTESFRNSGLIKNMYLKLVDAETLEILCQASFLGKYDGEEMQTVAAAMAEEFRIMTGAASDKEDNHGSE